MSFDLHSNSEDLPQTRNWRLYIMTVIMSMGSLASATSAIGGTIVLDSFKQDFGLNNISQHELDTLQGSIISTFQAGTFFGTILTFPIGEKIGRKGAIIFASAISLIGGILMTAANGHLSLIYAGRAISGFGIGSVSLLVPVYISETAPASIRGRLVGIFEIFSQTGGMAGFWINYVVHKAVSADKKLQWIIPLALQILPCLFLLCGGFWCPETPRWYAKRSRWEECSQTLAWTRNLPPDHKQVKAEIDDMVVATSRSSRNIHRYRLNNLKWYISRLLQQGTRNRIGIGVLLTAMQNLTGVNIITFSSPRIFGTLGVEGTDDKLLATGFYGLAKFLGIVVFSLWLVEKLGRRQGLVWGAFFGSIPIWYLGGYVCKNEHITAVAQQGDMERSSWGYLAILSVYLYGLICSATWQVITSVYCSEIFPSDIRMLCVAITTSNQWLWSFVVSRTTPYMITYLGYGTWVLFASLMVAMGIWAWLFVPETKGNTLEEMEVIFGAIPQQDLVQNRKSLEFDIEKRTDESTDSSRRVSFELNPHV
ncbi:hypothetical protein TWF694_010894 [Orbilia ellipsospora]|uniref:Major facilitator superfamily (MFS) profile domain-containing protein n=1 Tax=Orbilia ellipsospora TaxID=2528407 RepID=A0AAV9X8L9_9PEZI